MNRLTEHKVPSPKLQDEWRGSEKPVNLVCQNLSTGETAKYLFADPTPEAFPNATEMRAKKEGKLVDALGLAKRSRL